MNDTNELTVFDRIISKEIPAQIVYEDDDVLAFKDISPQAPIHVLIIPKRKRKNLTRLVEDGSDSEIVSLFKGVVKVAKSLGLTEGGYRIISNCGQQAGQTVDYLHIHLLAGKELGWTPA